MNQKYLKLAAQFLREYAERLGNDGCNDWDWPEGWSEGDKLAILEGPYVDDFGLDDGPPNWMIAGGLADAIESHLAA